MSANAALVDAVTTMALSKGCTPAQISIAWLLAQGCDIVPLVGTKTVARLAENAAAASVSLSAQEVAALSSLPQLRVPSFAPTPTPQCLFLSAQLLFCHTVAGTAALFMLDLLALSFFLLQGDRYPEQLHASSYNARMPSV